MNNYPVRYGVIEGQGLPASKWEVKHTRTMMLQAKKVTYQDQFGNIIEYIHYGQAAHNIRVT